MEVSGGKFKRGGGNTLLFLGEVNQGILFWGKGCTMHLTPPQRAIVNLPQGCACLFSALAKSQNVHIINKTNAGDGEVRGVAEVIKIGIIEEKE